MKLARIIRNILKVAVWSLMAIVLLPMAVIVILYSAWGQDALRTQVLPYLQKQGIDIRLDDFRLRYPLDISLAGLSVTMDGVEMVKADTVRADISLLPLLHGEAHISDATLRGGRLTIGAPDSAMYMTIDADRLHLLDAGVQLTNMHITLNDGSIEHGTVAMTLNPDTTATDTTATEPSDMLIDVRRLRMRDFTYRMRMLPVIDSLGANIGQGELINGRIDMKAQTVDLGKFAGASLSAAYIAPDSATIATTPVVETSADTTAAPWTVKIDSIAFTGSEALYTTRGVKPQPGLDFTYIQVDSVDLTVTDFYNQAAIVKLPVRVSGRERCGVWLDASGRLDIDETGLTFTDFNLSTPASTSLTFGGFLGTGDMTTDPTLPLRLKAEGHISAADARMMFPAFTPYLATLPSAGSIYALVDVGGTAGKLDINELSVAINGVARLSADGYIRNVFATDPMAMGGNIGLRGALIDLNPMKSLFLDKATAKSLNIPMTTFDGLIDMNSGNISGNLTARAADGEITLDADWHGRAEDYKLDLLAEQFPVDAFMPLLGVGRVDASLKVDGHGYNPFSEKMRLDAQLAVNSAVYGKYTFKDITGDVKLEAGQASIKLTSANPEADLSLDASGNLDGDTYVWTASLDGRNIDLYALGFSPTEAKIAVDMNLDASVQPKTNTIAAKLDLESLNYTTLTGDMALSNVVARLNANDSVTNLMAYNRDLYAYMSSTASLDTIMARVSRASVLADTLMAHKQIDVAAIQQALPPFVIDIDGGKNNFLNDILAENRMSINALQATISNDSVLNFDSRILGYESGATHIDTLTFDMNQHGRRLDIKGRIENRPGTFDEWAHVALDGYLADNKLGMTLDQHNIAGKQGYYIGLGAELTDSTVTAHVVPYDPKIAYKDWTVNDDNFLTWNFDHSHLDANLHMHGAGSSLAIYTDHADGQAADHQEQFVVQLTDIHLSDWIALNPFAPSMKGDVTADLRVGRTGSDISGDGVVTLSDFYYDRQRVGTISSDINVNTDMNGRIRATADISVDSVKTITLAGALNDSVAGSPLALDLSMIHFPLQTVNPFLPASMGRLSGTLNGQMDIKGTAADPKVNGWLQFDSTAVKVTMMGTSYTFSDEKIPVDSNVVVFDRFAIMGVNDNPLTIAGRVDLRDIANPSVDLTLNADNMQICNSNRAARGADVYGKGFIGLDATIRGNMDYMAVDANLRVLSGTNITYVMPEATNTITQQANSDLVKFVNFSDTAAVAASDSLVQTEMALRLDASLTVQSGSTINVDLSTDGSNKVRLQPQGTVEMTMAPFSEPRVTGRLNIDKGFVRYTPPLMSEKLFNFQAGSYVAFNGDMMNPILNIKAVDVLKANVTQSGQNSRLVNFDVLLSVTGSLENMDVKFDLSTDDDITVANELQSMSAEQRANQAMNMLLYNVYTGPGTKGDSSLSGNPLYSFLASQLNTWAANNIKGVDISFGIDQYDKTYNGSTSQTTSYSYQVSKSLFNDRFKIVVGGNYSTDANADENFSQNLINDISFDYYLNAAQTMYVRLFRHTGYESILEGEITQTGVGFVYKKKLTTLRRLFRGKRRKKTTSADTAADTTALTESKTEKTESEK